MEIPGIEFLRDIFKTHKGSSARREVSFGDTGWEWKDRLAPDAIVKASIAIDDISPSPDSPKVGLTATQLSLLGLVKEAPGSKPLEAQLVAALKHRTALVDERSFGLLMTTNEQGEQQLATVYNRGGERGGMSEKSVFVSPGLANALKLRPGDFIRLSHPGISSAEPPAT